MQTNPSTRELLTEYTLLINQHGVDSSEAHSLLDRHKDNIEFVELAETARWLKTALTAPQEEPEESACRFQQ